MRAAAVSLAFLVVALAVSLAAAYLLGVPRSDLPGLAVLLAGVGGGSGFLALLLSAALGRFGGVRGKLVGAGLVGSLLLAGMVVAGARAMFLSEHDLAVLLAMMIFAALLAVGFGLLFAMPMARRIEEVRRGTERLAGGEFGAQLPVEGSDEVSGLAADFNRMARMLQAAAEREREMEQARRDLVASVSHDLRTPLAAVRALIEAVADGVAEDDETRERYLASAQNELAHLGRLVDDLFELAQIDAGVLRLELEHASLHDLVSDTLSSFRPQAESKGVRLVGEVAGGVDPVLMSPSRIQRVLHNLLSNALRHTPADGTIAVRAEPDGEVVRVEVTDTGEGIAPEDLARVFERSYRGEKSRTRRDAGGAGLGLAIARGLVEAHGGRISAESRTGVGARFLFTVQRG